MSGVGNSIKTQPKLSKREQRRLARRREQEEICPKAWLDTCASLNQFMCLFCKGKDWISICRERGWLEHDWSAENWGNANRLGDHIRDWHQCLWCGIRFSDRNRKASHIAEFHGFRWGLPEGIPIDEGYLLKVPGWRRPEALPKTVEEFYSMIRPLLLLHIPGSGVVITTDEPDIDPIKGWHEPQDPPEMPNSVEDRRKWLEPLCVELIEADWPERVLETLPSSAERQGRYVEVHWERVTEFLMLKRYDRNRIRDSKRRAELLSAALVDPRNSASYAVQKYEVEHPVRQRIK